MRSLFIIICLILFSSCLWATNPEADTTQIIISNIHITGEHKTRDRLIIRELGFKQGDTLSKDNLLTTLEIAHVALMNTNLFNSVELNPTFSTDSSNMELEIAVKESWQLFIFPQVKFTADRNINAWLSSNEDDKFGRLSYGFTLKWGNFTGRREMLSFSFLAVDNYMAKIQYLLPFINKAQTWGILTGISFTAAKETNYNTQNDLAVFYKSSDFFSRKEISFYGGIQYRKGLFTTHQFKVLYTNSSYEDTVYKLNPNFSQQPFEAQQAIGLQYYLQIDHRNSVPYPTSGYYFDFEFTKQGLNLFDEYPNLYTLRSTFRKYWDLGKRWYVASAANVYACTDPNYPFYLQYGLGYDRFYVRGYERNLVKTQFYGLIKSNLKYAVLPEKVYYLKFIPTEKFNKIPLAIYANLFFDAGFTYDKQFKENNHYSNTGLFGYGLGIDISSYYQRVVRVEFTMNKQNEFGVYLSFIAPL